MLRIPAVKRHEGVRDMGHGDDDDMLCHSSISRALQNENVSTLDLCKNSHFYKLNISFSTSSMSK